MAGELERGKKARRTSNTYKANGLSGAAEETDEETHGSYNKVQEQLEAKVHCGCNGMEEALLALLRNRYRVHLLLDTAGSVKASWQQVANAPAQDML